MTATPLQIVNVCKLGDSVSATVIQWHVIAMFAPSFFTGSIINFLGNRKVMMMGVLLYIISICVGVMGQTTEYFWISLFLCGLGWNFLYVGGSDIIAIMSLPPTYRKFHPKPHKNSDIQKYSVVCPITPTQIDIMYNKTPIIITLRLPRKFIIDPVKNEGANIAITCH